MISVRKTFLNYSFCKSCDTSQTWTWYRLTGQTTSELRSWLWINWRYITHYFLTLMTSFDVTASTSDMGRFLIFLRLSSSWISQLSLHDNSYMVLINNNEFWMTVEHWERFCVLRVSRLLMAVINFKTALLLFLLHNPIARLMIQFPKYLQSCKIPHRCSQSPWSPLWWPPGTCRWWWSPRSRCLASWAHEQIHITSNVTENIPLTHVTETVRKSTVGFNWGFAWFLDFTKNY